MEINNKPVKPSDLVTNSMKSQDETLSKMGLSKTWTSALFKKMQARYGHKWTSAYDDILETAIQEWSEVLNGLTGEQIKHGLDFWREDWPPSAPEFKRVCLNEKPKINDFGLDYVPECYRETKRERLLESDENKAKHKAAYEAGMSGLKNILKKS